jgi:histidinol-phosphate aminotransferase
MSGLLVKPREKVRSIKEYHPPLGGRAGLRLDFNENTFSCSPRVREVLSAISAEALTMYPEREPVEAQVAARLGIQPGQLVLTNGVDEAIHVLFSAFLDAGDELLLPVPAYTMYEVYASSTDARIVKVQAGEDFSFPRERLMAAINSRTKIIAIANPNSPTGAVAGRETLVEIARLAPHALLLADEAYFHFYGQSVIDLAGKIPNLVVARTFSKDYGLAGLRIGALAASAETLGWVRRVLSPYSVNALALACLPAALADEDFLANYTAEVRTARAEFEHAVDALGIRRWPSEANFILVEIGPLHREFAAAMHERGVLVRDRSGDPGCDGCGRITIGTRAQMQRAAAAMREVLNGLKGAAGQKWQ